MTKGEGITTHDIPTLASGSVGTPTDMKWSVGARTHDTFAVNPVDEPEFTFLYCRFNEARYTN